MITFILNNLIYPLLFTILVEGLLACLFIRQKEDIITVILAQCITNPILNASILAVSFFYYYNYNISNYLYWPLIIVLELGAVITEALIYKKYFSSAHKKLAWLFSFFANIASFSIGLLLMV